MKFKESIVYYHLYLIRNGYRYLYTLWFNHRIFPWGIAKYLPIVFFKDAYAELDGRGKIVLSGSFLAGNKHMCIGEETKDFDYQCEKTYLHIEGILSLSGNVSVRRGAMLDVCGEMSLGDDVVIGPRVRIRAHKKITIGNTVRIAHEVQIFDTNFHFSEDVMHPQYNPISCPIVIGDYCWIGNRTTISKGTVLPDRTTVASNSLTTKDYSGYPSNSLIGGMPAKLLKNNFARVWDTDRELEYQKREFEWYKLRHEK